MASAPESVGPVPVAGSISPSKSASGPTSLPEPYHVYHAEAQLLKGELIHPLRQPLEEYGRVALEKTRREGHFTRSVGGTSVENLVFFDSGYTSVSGSQLKDKDKEDHWGHRHSGWVTLATSVLKGFNAFEVITADRLVAQVSTEHARTNGHVPAVTFLGTRFEGLKIGGYPIEVKLDLGICGSIPNGNRNYMEDPGFRDRVETQLKQVAGLRGLPHSLEKEYAEKIALIARSKLYCSLVKSIGPIPIPGVKTFGHVIYIPDFGTVSLAELEVGIDDSDPAFDSTPSTKPYSNYFSLEMLNIKMGSIGGGSYAAGGVKANGQTRP